MRKRATTRAPTVAFQLLKQRKHELTKFVATRRTLTAPEIVAELHADPALLKIWGDKAPSYILRCVQKEIHKFPARKERVACASLVSKLKGNPDKPVPHNLDQIKLSKTRLEIRATHQKWFQEMEWKSFGTGEVVDFSTVLDKRKCTAPVRSRCSSCQRGERARWEGGGREHRSTRQLRDRRCSQSSCMRYVRACAAAAVHLR